MGTYKIHGKDYSFAELLEDLSIIRKVKESESSKLVKAVKERGINITNTFTHINEKKAFLQEILGYKGLYGEEGVHILLDECSEARIGQAFRRTILPHIDRIHGFELAEARVAEYSRLANEDFKREKAEAKKALEDFKRENPEKYRKNYLEAIRA